MLIPKKGDRFVYHRQSGEDTMLEVQFVNYDSEEVYVIIGDREYEEISFKEWIELMKNGTLATEASDD